MLDDIKDALRRAGVPVCTGYDGELDCFAVVRPQQITPVAYERGRPVREKVYACVDYYFDVHRDWTPEAIGGQLRGVGWRVEDVAEKTGGGGVVITISKQRWTGWQSG